MSKAAKPLLSLGAHGTLGEAITYQKRGGQTIVRAKPFPKQPNSLPQQYQRWLYEDYAAYWHQQTAAVKQTYQSAGVRFHLTGYQYWMKYHLTNLPDIAAWWRLDNTADGIAYDSSKNNDHGTIIGAIPATGPINGCLYWDGLNDQILIGTKATHNPQPPFTVECQVKHFSNLAFGFVFGNSGTGAIDSGFSVTVRLGQNATIYVYNAAGGKQTWDFGVVPFDTQSHLAFTHDGTTVRTFCRGLFVNQVAVNGITPATAALYLGRYQAAAADWLKGYADNFLIYTRILDDATLLRHSQRRYPA